MCRLAKWFGFSFVGFFLFDCRLSGVGWDGGSRNYWKAAPSLKGALLFLIIIEVGPTRRSSGYRWNHFKIIRMECFDLCSAEDLVSAAWYSIRKAQQLSEWLCENSPNSNVFALCRNFCHHPVSKAFPHAEESRKQGHWTSHDQERTLVKQIETLGRRVCGCKQRSCQKHRDALTSRSV